MILIVQLKNNGIPTTSINNLQMKIPTINVYELHGDAQYDFNILQISVRDYDLILGNEFYKYNKALEDGNLSLFLGNIFFSFIAGILIGLYFEDFKLKHNKSFFNDQR